MYNEDMEAIVKNFSRQLTESSGILRYPSMLREISRNMDLWGTLDSYNYSDDEVSADKEALRRDYLIAMHELARAQKEISKKKRHGKKED
jgi:hypothetical protein